LNHKLYQRFTVMLPNLRFKCRALPNPQIVCMPNGSAACELTRSVHLTFIRKCEPHAPAYSKQLIIVNCQTVNAHRVHKRMSNM
jgi:hypothetical protein